MATGYGSSSARTHTGNPRRHGNGFIAGKRGSVISRISMSFFAFVLSMAMIPPAAFAQDASSVDNPTQSETQVTSAGGGLAGEAPGDRTVAEDASGEEAATSGDAVADGSTSDEAAVVADVTPASSTTTGEVSSSDTTAAPVTTQATDTVVTPQSAVKVTVQVIGPSAAGTPTTWVAQTAFDGTTADTATAATKTVFDNAGLTYSMPSTAYGSYLASIASPLDGTVYDNNTAPYYWQLIVNGSSSSFGSDYVPLTDGMTITWYYCADGAALPDGSVEYESSSTALPTYDADWASFCANSSTVTATCPTEGVDVSWAFDASVYKVGYSTYASEPLLVNNKVYMAINHTLARIDCATGQVEATGKLAGTVDYTSRPLYAQGLIVVALDGGAVQAFDAETLKTRWLTTTTGTSDQSSCTLTVADGVVYTGTDAPIYDPVTWAKTGESGCIRAIDLATGAVKWTATNGTSGFYWTGVAQGGSYSYSDWSGSHTDTYKVVGDTAGTMHVYFYDATQYTEVEKSSLSLGSAAVNSDPVAYDGDLLVLTRDGILHRLAISPEGSLSEVSRVSVGSSGKAAPTVVGDTAFIGTSSDDGSASQLSMVDLSTMTVTSRITTAGGSVLPVGLGGISAPVLVSRQAAGTYAYFTVNAAEGSYPSYTSGGALYVYKLGDTQAAQLFLPTGTYANLCDSPVICDKSGALYYLNDSGFLLKLVAKSSTGGGGNSGGSGTGGNAGGSSAGDSGNGGTGVDSNGNGSESASSDTDSASASHGSTVAATHTAVDSSATGTATTTNTVAAPVANTSTVSGVSTHATTGSATPDGVTDASTASTTARPVWPWICLGVGVVGLAAVAFFVLATKRRRRDDGEASR